MMATMDANANRSAVMFDQPFAAPTSQSTGSSQSPQRSGRAKRARASDAALDPAKQQEKREKARERQRRKRERDKRRHMADAALHLASFPGIQEAVAAAASSSSNPIPVQQQQQQQQHLPVQLQQQHPPPPPPAVQQPFPSPPQPQEVQQAHTLPPPSLPQPTVVPQNEVLTPEELNRRDRVRAAARERQRKHRALVKQKKMAELGLAMGNDGVGGMEEIHYALGPDGQYQPVAPPQQELSAEQPFPQGHTGGQTFASTLLLSFSCSPLLKQHLLRSLHMTNEELASLEPILSAAWDQWDHARRIHYAEQAAKANTEHQQQNGAGPSSSGTTPFVPPQQVDEQNDFRARFHRPLTAPSPFGNATNGAAPSPGQPQAQIDPTLRQQQSQAQGPANGLVNGLNGTASNTDSTADGEGEIDMEEKDEEDVAKGLEG